LIVSKTCPKPGSKDNKKHPLAPTAGVTETTVYFVEVGVGEWNE